MARRPLNPDMVRTHRRPAARPPIPHLRCRPRLPDALPDAGAPAPLPRPRTTAALLPQEALRDYVLADSGAQNQAESTVRLVVTHSNLKASFMDIRLDMHVRARREGGGGLLGGSQPCSLQSVGWRSTAGGLSESCSGSRRPCSCCAPAGPPDHPAPTHPQRPPASAARPHR